MSSKTNLYVRVWPESDMSLNFPRLDLSNSKKFDIRIKFSTTKTSDHSNSTWSALKIFWFSSGSGRAWKRKWGAGLLLFELEIKVQIRILGWPNPTRSKHISSHGVSIDLFRTQISIYQSAFQVFSLYRYASVGIELPFLFMISAFYFACILVWEKSQEISSFNQLWEIKKQKKNFWS